MATNSYFYSPVDIQRMKELIRTGQPLSQIARNEYDNFGTTESALYMKLLKIAKTTRKVKKWEGPKRTSVTKTTAVSGIAVPQGTTFEGTPKKVVIYKDHFRVYF